MEITKLDRTKAPVASPMVKVPFPQVSLNHLDNGIPVYTVQFGSQEIVEIDALFPAGRSFEAKTGISDFSARIMQEGTENYTGLELAKLLDSYGASLSSETGNESATFNLTTLSKYLGNTVPLLSEMLLRPSFPEKELVILKARSIRSLEVEEKKTSFIARKEFNWLLNGQEHPYGKTTTVSDIRSLEMEALKDFYERNFNLSNCRLVASGRFDEDRLLDLLNKEFGTESQIDPSKKVSPSESAATAPLPSESSGFHYFEQENTMQATVRVGHRGFARNHSDYYPMQVVNTILGGYFGSRLMKNIREEKGFTYGIYSAWLSMKYGGTFVVQTDVGNEYIRPTLDEIRKEIHLLINTGVRDGELELVKNYMLGRSISARETPSQIGSLIRTCLVNELDFSELDKQFDVIQSVQPEDVRRLTSKYLLPEQLLEVVCGNMKQEFHS